MSLPNEARELLAHAQTAGLPSTHASAHNLDRLQARILTGERVDIESPSVEPPAAGLTVLQVVVPLVLAGAVAAWVALTGQDNPPRPTIEVVAVAPVRPVEPVVVAQDSGAAALPSPAPSAKVAAAPADGLVDPVERSPAPAPGPDATGVDANRPAKTRRSDRPNATDSGGPSTAKRGRAPKSAEVPSSGSAEADTLLAEQTLIASALAGLRNDDLARARAALGKHAKRHRDGKLRAERVALQHVLRCRAKERGAQQAARDFLRSGTPAHAGRVRRACGL